MARYSEQILAEAMALSNDECEVICEYSESITYSPTAVQQTVSPADTKYIDTTARPVSRPLPQSQYHSLRQDCYDFPPSLPDVKKAWATQWPSDYAKLFTKRNATKRPLKPFSAEFQSAIGEDPVQNISGIEDYNQAVRFWDMLLEVYATGTYVSRYCGYARDFWWYLDEHYAISTRSGMLIDWSGDGASGRGFLELICHAFGVDPWTARATLSRVLKLNFENLVSLASAIQGSEREPSTITVDCTPNILVSANPGAPIARLLGQHSIQGYSGLVVGAFTHYGLGNYDFCVPAGVNGHGRFCIGQDKLPAYFFNQQLLYKHQDAVVLLFPDVRVAMAIQARLDELPGYNPNEFIITAHLGEALNLLLWNCISGHDMVFVSAPTSESYARFSEYKKFAESVHARSCKLATRLFLHRHHDIESLRNISLQNAEETKLLNNAVLPDKCDDIIHVVRSTISTAIDAKQSNEWLTKLGLLTPHTDMPVVTSKALRLKLPKPQASSLSNLPQNLSEATLRASFWYGVYIMVVGQKDSGKTQVALGAMGQLLNGDQIWPFCPPVGQAEFNVCLVDGETPTDELEGNLIQHGLAKHRKKRLFVISIYDSELPDFCAKFSLRSEQFRQGLKNFLLEHNCGYLFLDNLISLADNNPDGCSGEILSWITELQRAGICVCVLHHAALDDNAKARSNENYINKARVRIDLVHKEKITDVPNFPEQFRQLATDPMLTVGIHYKYHKSAPVMAGNTFWISLPMGEKSWLFRGATDAAGKPIACPWPENTDPCCLPPEAHQDKPVAQAATPTVALPESPSPETTQSDPALSYDERMALNAIKEIGGTVKRSDVQRKCGWGEEKTTAILGQLASRKLIVRKGNGKSTYYAMTQQ